MLDPVMIDSRGAKIETWLPHMQSEEFLREMIASGTRTEECWAELKSRNLRVQAGRDVITITCGRYATRRDLELIK